jgi:hypothetical protein
MGRPVQHPAVGVAIGGDPAVDRSAGVLRVEPVADEWRELGECGQERGRVGGPAELLEDDCEFDGILGIGELGPTGVDVGLPQRRRVNAVFGDTAHQRGRALFGDGVTHRLLPQPLIVVELQ